MRGRGVLAWQNHGDGLARGRLAGGITRTLVHGVMDTTALRFYVPSTRKFLAWAEGRDLDIFSPRRLDWALADYIDYLAYGTSVGPAAGGQLLSGIQAVFPEAADHLPQSWRSLTSWQRIAPGGEGAGLAMQQIAILEEEMRRLGHDEAADILVVRTDMYLRNQDIQLLRVEDVFDAGGDEMSVSLGVVSRGEQVKSGTRQGVRVDYPKTRRILRERATNKKRGDKVFCLSEAAFLEIWMVLFSFFGWHYCPPHSLRHTGPTYDAYLNYRSLTQIQWRGRWTALTSVQRYTKSHVYVEQLAQLSEEQKQRGLQLLKTWGNRSEKAKQ